LFAVCPGLDKHHFFGQAIGGVGYFGVALPEVFFAEGNGGMVGIGADGSQGDELVDVVEVAFVDELGSHHDVVVEKGGRVFPVIADAAYFCGQMDDDVRFLFVVEAANVGDVREVVFGKVGYLKL